MKIVSLAAENFKRLRAIMIRPDGSTVIVGGKNGAGKSSALDAIRAALGGKKHCPEEPIRRGAKKAQIVLESDELTVTRTFSKKGTALEVTAKDGTTFASPQAMLDKLVGSLSFDPLEFSRMKPPAQSEVVRRLVGLDFAELDKKRETLYSDRTMVSRDLKGAVALLDNLPIVEAPESEVSVADAMQELARQRGINDSNAAARQDLVDLRGEDAHQTASIKQQKTDLDRFTKSQKTELERLVKSYEEVTERGIKEHLEKIAGLEQRRMKARDAGKDLAAKVEACKDENTAEIEATIEGAEEANRKVRAVADRKRAEAQYNKYAEAVTDLNRKIETIDEKKAEAIQSAKYPIDGLQVTDDGVELHDLPFEQASSAEQLRCSVGMGLALNPKLKVLLVKDGSLLDEDSLKLIAEMATAADAQVWIERVGKGDECTVIIEDGSIEGVGADTKAVE